MIYLYIGMSLLIFLFAEWLFFRKYMSSLIERRIAAYQNDLIAKHCDEVENIYRQMRGWRHDYHNHIQAMVALIDSVVAEDHAGTLLRNYLLSLNNDLAAVDTVIKTGNIMTDAILNSKISLAMSKNISVDATATVPKDLRMQNIDLCVILGNLLDNAIEACQTITGSEAWIRIYIGMHKEMFYIYVSNSTTGEHKRLGARYLSTKKQEGHGLGLVRIDKIVNKYNGFVDRQNEPGVFATEVMLPL